MNTKLYDHLQSFPPKLFKSGVLIVDPDPRRTSYTALLFKGQTVSFEVKEVEQALKFELDMEANMSLVDASGDDDDFETAYKLGLNRLPDWHVDHIATFQLEVLRERAPFFAKLPRPIVATGVKHIAVVKAKLANHRAIARLVVQFINTDTGESETAFVEFDPTYIGGKIEAHYQDVEIVAPKSYENFEVFFFIDFRPKTENTSPANPFLFLWDIHLAEREMNFGMEMVSFSKAEMEQRWLYAGVKGGIKDTDCLFVECGGEIAVLKTKAVIQGAHFFDENYYREKNPGLNFNDIDPFTHYLLIGSKENRKPNPEFSVREYLLRHPDVEAGDVDPLVHYACFGNEQQRSLGTFEETLNNIWKSEGQEIPAVAPNIILMRAQDLMVPMEIIDTQKLAVFFVPEHNVMSGGIYSIFSIANVMRKARRQHGFDVLIMTRPNSDSTTYLRNSAFRNAETVLRAEQLRLFSEVSELQLHIPEYATVEFVRNLSQELTQYLLKRDHLHINILNQNIRLMPEPEKFRDLRRMADTIGQSISHHAFFNQDLTDHYDLPSLLLPAYTDLTPFPASSFEEKENLILYSDDDATYKKAVLDQLREMGDYELVKIKDITFDMYMDLATRCKFSVSFGEGFDGYVAQPIYQGGIGMALYTDEFFPDDSYMDFENFFNTEKEMIDGIVPTIRRLEKDKSRYEALNAGLLAKWEKLYNYDDYVAQIGKLGRREYEIFPSINTSA